LLPKPTTVYKNVHATDMFDKNVPLNMTNPDKFIFKTSIIHKKYYDGHCMHEDRHLTTLQTK